MFFFAADAADYATMPLLPPPLSPLRRHADISLPYAAFDVTSQLLCRCLLRHAALCHSALILLPPLRR